MTPSRRGRPPSASGAFWPPLRSRPGRRCCWRATCPAWRWRSRGCCGEPSGGAGGVRQARSARGPYFEETLYVTPSRLPAAVLGEVEAVTARAARALGLREGPIHAELRVDGERVSERA